MRFHVFAMTLCLLLSMGCRVTKTAALQSSPSGAVVKINGQHVGQTPLQYEFDFGQEEQFAVVMSRRGYEDATFIVRRNDNELENGVITRTLARGEWTEEDRMKLLRLLEAEARTKLNRFTSGSRANNTWLKMEVHKDRSYEDSWRRIVSSLTGVYDSLEEMEKTSGYIRSIFRVKKVEVTYHDLEAALQDGEDAYLLGLLAEMLERVTIFEWALRNKVVCAVDSMQPLVFKIKVVSERARVVANKAESEWTWEPHDTVFTEDAEMIEQLQNQLAIFIQNQPDEKPKDDDY